MGTVSDEIPPGPEEFPVPVIPATFSEESFVVPSSPGVPQATDLILYFLANLQNILSVLPPVVPPPCEELPEVLLSEAISPSEELSDVLSPAVEAGPCEELSDMLCPAVEPSPCGKLPDILPPALEPGP